LVPATAFADSGDCDASCTQQCGTDQTCYLNCMSQCCMAACGTDMTCMQNCMLYAAAVTCRNRGCRDALDFCTDECYRKPCKDGGLDPKFNRCENVTNGCNCRTY